MKDPIVVFALATLLVGVPVIAQTQSEEDRILDARAEFNDAISRHDVAAIISFLDEEYQITTSLGQMSQGRDEEAASWSEVFASRPDVSYVRSAGIVEISETYPLAAESGTWIGTWSTADGLVRTGGSYAAMWHQVDGSWKVRSELFVALFCKGADCPSGN